MSYPTFFVWLILQFSVVVCHAQYYFKHYQTQDGLPHQAVRSILQDGKGFMWVGTRAGLCRFDGYNFKLCENKNDPFNNIGNNVINTLTEGQPGILWIGTGKGMYRYDTIGEVISPIDLIPQIYIEQVVANGDDIWFIANSSLWRYSIKKNVVKNYQVQTTALFLDGAKNLWTGNKQGEIRIFDPRGVLVKTMKTVNLDRPSNMNTISAIFPLDDGAVLVGYFGSGLKRYDLDKRTTATIVHSVKGDNAIFVRDICKGNNGDYWVATESGVYIYNPNIKKCWHLGKRADDPYAMTDNAVYKVCKDKSGGMWLGTFFGGLNYCSLENARFRKYYPIVGQNSISGYAVRELVPDRDGQLWIGTEDAGLNRFDPQRQLFKHYPTTGENALSYPNIHGLLAVGNDLLVGPFHRGLEIMDIRTGLIRQQHRAVGLPAESGNDFVLSIFQTSDSTILVGTAYDENAGLFRYDLKRKTFDRINHIPGRPYVLSIREDRNGFIWVGTMSNGVYYYHPKSGVQGNIRFGSSTKTGQIPEFPVYGIHEDSMGSMWFATEGGGLIRLSRDRTSTKRYDTAAGFPTNVYFSILEDDFQNLWISSLKGLLCLDIKTETFRNYHQANGLITDQFNFCSAYKDRSGSLYFGSVKGLIAFDPKDFLNTGPRPALFITGLEIDNKAIHPGMDKSPIKRSVVYLDSICLAYNQNNFSIEFAALNYASPAVTRYEYMLEGLAQKRTILASNRKAYFTDIQPGKYIFTVRAKSNTGSWRSIERRVVIIIKPPFWKTFAAYSFYTLLVIVLLVLIALYYHRWTIRKNAAKLMRFEHEKEREIYAAKIEFFTHITHEIQTPLTLILGRVQGMLRKITDGDTIRKNLLQVEKNTLRLTELTAELLDFRKTELHQFGLNFVKTNIVDLLKEVTSSFEQIAEQNNIRLNSTYPKDDVIAFVDREATVKILNNLLSNAIKYGLTYVNVHLADPDIEKNSFNIAVENDSEPIPDKYAKKIFEPFFRLENSLGFGTGIGLSLAKSLSELHKGTLQLIESGGSLVVFELVLPLRQEREFELSSWKKIK